MLQRLYDSVRNGSKKVRSFISGMLMMGIMLPMMMPVFGPAAKADGPCLNCNPADEPLIRVSQASQVPGGYTTGLTAQPGDRLAFRIYVHNNVVGTTANEVFARATMPTTQATSQSVSATVTSPNANTVNGTATVNSGSNFRLEYIAGTTKKYKLQNNQWVTEDLPDSFLQNGTNLGALQGCFEYIQYIVFHANVVAQTNPAVINLAKTVSLGDGTSNFVENVTAKQNDIVRFRLIVNNTGGETASNVLVSDSLPSGLEYVPNTTTVDGQSQADGITTNGFRISSINTGASKTVIFNARVTSNTAGTLTNTGVAAIEGKEPVRDTATVTIQNVQGPRLTIAKTVSLGEGSSNFVENVTASQNDTVRFQLVMGNTGDQALDNVLVSDSLPSGLEYIANTTRVDGSNVNDGITTNGIRIGNVNPSASKIVIFNARVTNSSTSILTNTGVASAYNHEVVRDTATVTGTNSGNAVMTIAKTVALGENSTNFSENVNANQDDIVRFQLVINSTGAKALDTVTVSDVLPSGLDYVSGSTRLDGASVENGIASNGIKIGNINAGNSKTVIFNARVSSSNTGTITNTGVASALNHEVVRDTATVQGSNNNRPYLTVDKSVDRTTANAGDELRYTIRVRNTGNGDATNVRVTDSLPSRVRYISGTLETSVSGGNSVSSTDLFGNGVVVNRLRSNEELVIRFNARIDSDVSNGTRLENVTVARDDQNDRAEDTVVTEIEGDNAYLDITKTVDKSRANAGDELRYTVTVRNIGDSDAINVRIYDVLPSKVTFVSGSLQVDGEYITNTDLFGSGVRASRLRNVDDIVITFRAKIDSNITSETTLENVANATADGGLSDRAVAATIVGGASDTAKATIVKMVRNETKGETVFYESNSANPGNVLEYKFTVTNTGNTRLTNVKVRDVLPSQLMYLGGTAKAWMNSNEISGDWNKVVESNGVNLSELNPGDVVTILFKAKSSTDIANNSTLTNTAYLTADPGINLSSFARTTFNTIAVPQTLPDTGPNGIIAVLSFLLISSISWLIREKWLLMQMM